MMPDEKVRILAFLDREEKWCREAEARDANGTAVQYDDPKASAWDITGAMCNLFGWNRACVLFGQLDRHIRGKRRAPAWPERDLSIDAMVVLQEFNDDPQTSFAALREILESMSVWQGTPRRLETTINSPGFDE